MPFSRPKQTRIQTRLAEQRRHELYDADMGQAHAHLLAGEIDQAVALLREYLPKADSGPDLRGFEWYEMVHRCRRRLEATTIPTQYPTWSVAIGAQGDLAVGAYNRGPKVYELATGTLRWSPPTEGKRVAVCAALAFTVDGRLLVSVSEDQTLKVWNAKDGSLLHTEPLPKRPASLAISASGVVAVGLWSELGESFPRATPAPILLYELAVEDEHLAVKLTAAGRLDGAKGVVHDLAFSPRRQIAGRRE